MSEPKPAPAPPSPPPRTWLRVLSWLLGIAALGCVFLLLATSFLLSHLDSGPVRRRIQALSHSAAGIDLDYRRVDASLFSGLTLHDLVIASAPPDAALAPALVRIGELKVSWSLRALAGGTIGQVRIHGVAVTVVEDENGETSVERWNARRLSITGPPPPLGPLSHLLADSLPKGQVALGSLAVDDVTATILRTRAGQVVERVQAGVVALSGQARAGQGRLDADFNAGTAKQPLALTIVRASLDPAGQAVPASERVLALETSLRISCTAEEVSLALEATVARHDLLPSLPTGTLVRAQAKVHFDPSHAKASVRLEQLELVGGAVHASAELDLLDDTGHGAQTVLRAASATAALDVLADRLRELVPAGTRLTRGTFELAVQKASAPDGSAPGETRFPGLPVVLAAGQQLELGLDLQGVEARSGEAPVRLRSVRLDAHAVGGKARLELRMKALAQGPVARPSLEVDEASLTADLSPRGDGKLAVRATMPIGRAQVHGQGLLDARRVSLGVDGLVQGDGRFDGDVTLSLGELRSSARGATTTARELAMTATLTGARSGGDDPLASEAGVALRGRLGSVVQAQGQKKTQAGGVGMELTTKLAGRALERTTLRVPIERLGLEDGGGGPRLAPQRALFSLELEPMKLDLAEPARQVKALVRLDAGPVGLRARIDKQGGTVAFELDARAERLGPFAGLLRGSLPDEERAAWEGVGLTLQTQGTARGVGRTATLSVDQKTRASLQRVSVRREGLDFSSQAIDLRLATRGTLKAHTFDLFFGLDAPRLNGRGGEGKQTVTLAGSYDLERPRLELHVAGKGVLGPDGTLDAKAGYDVASRLLSFQLDGAFDRLGLLGVVLPPSLLGQHHVGWEKLGLRAHAQASLPSIVAGYQPGLPPRFVFAKAPLTAIRGATALTVSLTGLDYRGANELAAALPSLSVHVESRADDGHLHAEATLELPALKARASGHRLAGEKLAASLVFDALGDLATGTATARAGFTAASLRQDAAPQYPMGDVELKLAARADAKGSVRIEEGSFANPLGGTRLELKGGLDFGPLDPNLDLRAAKSALTRAFAGSLIPGRRNLLIEGQLSQKLELVNGTGRALGQGTVTVPLRVESGDLSYVRASAGLKFEGVDLDLPDAGLSVTGLNGFIPVAQDLLVNDQGGLSRSFGATTTAYSRLRFTDQQPFMSGNPYVTVQKIQLDLSKKGEPGRTLVLGPLAGNVRVDRNLIAIDQLEAELSSGKVTGQVLIDGQGEATQVAFRGALTGLVTEGTDDRLDANLALAFWPTRRLLEGRIELVRLGRTHLTRLLDLYDPYQADVAANRMRLAMKFGYPKSVRMGFHDGFASLALELGGLAQAVRIDELRGMPIGPVLERYLARSPQKEEAP